jgi:hypothetical protein
MKGLFGKVLGDSPVTSVMGYVLAILAVVHPLLQAGTTDWMTIATAVFTALLGRSASDSKKPDE